MEPLPHRRRKKSASRFSVLLSLVFHVLVACVAFFWAAHEGVLGKKLMNLTVALVPPEKPPEPPQEKPPIPKLEPPKDEPKPEPPKVVEESKPPPAPAGSAAPPATPSATAVAPAPASFSDFNFSDGAKTVETGTNAAMLLYKSQVEYALRSNWQRPEGQEDFGYVAEVELSLDADGRIISFAFQQKSGNPDWDESVKRAILATKGISVPQPKGFPGKFVVRFDVLSVAADTNLP